MQPIEQADASPQSVIGKWFGVTSHEIDELFRSEPNPGAFNKAVLVAVGLFLTPITLAGALLGFTRAYNRFTRRLSVAPTFANLTPITKFAMVVGALLIWVAVFSLFIALL